MPNTLYYKHNNKERNIMNNQKNMPDFPNMTPFDIAEKLQEHFDDLDMSITDRDEINELMNEIHIHVEQIAKSEDLAREEDEYLKEL
jgi:hypothetical protein